MKLPSSITSLDQHPHLRRTLLALISGVLISGLGFLIDHVFHNAQRLLASDFYTCGIAFVLSYVLLEREGRRRAALARRMEVAAEVNHHIRNALTGVVFTAAVQNDPLLESVIRDATERIDWVLNTVLPDGASELRWPVQSRAWNPAPWAPRRETSTMPPPPLPPGLHVAPHLAPLPPTCDTGLRDAGHTDSRQQSQSSPLPF